MENGDADKLARFCVNLRGNGLGAGLAVQTPELVRDSGLRVLPLSGFPSLPIGVFWRGRLSEIAQVFVERTGRQGEADFWQAQSASGLMS